MKQLLSFFKIAMALCLVLSSFYLLPASAAPMRVIYGYDREFPPFSFQDPGGKETGFEVDLIKAIFNDQDVHLVMRPLNWNVIPIELSSGVLHITSGMVKTPQRSSLFLFSDKPSFSLQIKLFTKVYNRFPSLHFFKGQAVAVEESSFQQYLLEQYGGINVKTYKGRVDGIKALYNDVVPAFCGPVPNTYYFINKLNYGAITTVGTPLGSTEMRFAINSGRGDLQRMINQGLEKVIASGEYNRLYRKWFVRELTDSERDLMIKTATNAAVPAYTPYGGEEPQGAVVFTATGKIYSACTVENANPALNLSATRAALSRAISDGEYEIRAAAIVNAEGKVVMPTPDDLQSLYEFGRGILIVTQPSSKQFDTKMVADLLPEPITKEIILKNTQSTGTTLH